MVSTAAAIRDCESQQDMQKPRSPALRLLLACARAHLSAEGEKAILALLDENPDWVQFAQLALSHGLAGLAGHTLVRVAPDRIPADIADAFRTLIEKSRTDNRLLVNELFALVSHLEEAGVEPICFKGPVLAMEAFGDLGLRGFRDLDILIRDRDLHRALESLKAQGYERNGELTPVQFDVIHRLQGQEIMFKKDAVAIEPHTRLTPLKMALSIDYDGLWRRARRQDVCGKMLLTFTAEDTLLVLAIHGGKELWWNIKWACDVADFITSHPGLDWEVILERAEKQGCLRMLLVATSLARNYLGTEIPAGVVASGAADRTVGKIIARIMTRWEMDDPVGPPSNKMLSLDRFLLHDGPFRRASYVMRTWFLPGPQHIPLMRIPTTLTFLYIPIGLAHDLFALPLYRLYEKCRNPAIAAREMVARSSLAAALSPALAEERRKNKVLQQLLAATEEATSANPNDNIAWTNKGDILTRMGQPQRAIACYDRSLRIVPNNNYTWTRRSVAFAALRKLTKRPDLSDEPDFDPQTAEGWTLRAGYLAAAKRFVDADKASDCALRLDPDNEIALRIGIEARQSICDWTKRQSDNRVAEENLKSGVVILRPINFKQVFDSAQSSWTLAHHWMKKMPRGPAWRGERYRHDKIRVAYLSTDLRAHPVGNTVLGLLERHDKERFEITAISIGPDDQSRTRKRIQAAVDSFVDASTMGDSAIAALIREEEIDIAVDLNGLTGGKRTTILAQRPAPVQVNYLGYPGTMAVPFIDYLIADPVVIPEESRHFYSEKIAYLPDSYLPYDTGKLISEKVPSRRDQGLPESAFVFACFNTTPKISPEVFDVWMRLLHQVEGSVLWLAGSTNPAIANLRREAAVRGIAPERLIFAQFEKDTADHLARQSLADIFLDTMPYNAHSTGNDALWAGLPILTTLGNDFQSRVAASLLTAVGLPELVTKSLVEYEECALLLAREPRRLTLLRERLARNRRTAPLFDIGRYTKNLEAIYATMWRRQQSGLPPESFSVGS